MIDVTQILIASVIVVLTATLTIVAIQVLFILREFRQTLKKANKVLDDTGIISESVSKQYEVVAREVKKLEEKTTGQMKESVTNLGKKVKNLGQKLESVAAHKHIFSRGGKPLR